MVNPFDRIDIRTLASVISATLFLIGGMVAATSAFTLREAQRMGVTWRSFDEGPASKAVALSRLRDALGYGGTIHQFKNFVIRKDRRRIVPIQRALMEVSVALSAYESGGVNADESAALEVLDRVWTEYGHAVAVAEYMASQGESIRDIDEAVRIDDTPALDAMATLDRELSRAREASSEWVAASVAGVRMWVTLTMIVVILLLLVVVFGFFWFTLVRLVKPMARLERTMRDLAAGDTSVSVSVPEIERNDEIGAMAMAVEVFKENTIERVKADEALRESERRVRTITENIPGGVFRRVLHADGTVTFPFMSPGIKELLGLDADEIVANPETLHGTLHPDDRERWQANLRESAATLVPDELEFRRVARSGEIKWLYTRAQPYHGDSGDVIWDGVALDVTEKKVAELELVKAKEEAEFANRCKTEFIANVSHELRTPLNAIIGFSEMIGQEIFGPVGDDKYGEYAGHIRDSGVHLLELINDLIDIARIEISELNLDEEVIDVRKLYAACKTMVKERARTARIELAEEIAADMPAFRGDAVRVKQILINLLTNAVKFTPAGGRVTFNVGLDARGRIALAVEDTGIGIAAEDIPRVLEPFGQVGDVMTRSIAGTGLGLSLVRSLAKLHGGTVEIESRVGRGTRVRVTLPSERILRSEAAE